MEAIKFPRVFWVESELRLALLKTQADFVRQLAKEIRSEELEGSTFWRKGYELVEAQGIKPSRPVQGSAQVLRGGVHLDAGNASRRPARTKVRIKARTKVGRPPTKVRQHPGQGPQFLESVPEDLAPKAQPSG